MFCASISCMFAQSSIGGDSVTVARQAPEAPRVSPSTLIIWYNHKYKKKLLKAIKKYKAEIIYDYKNFNGVAIKIPEGKDIDKAQKHFQKVKGVLSVNRDQIMNIQSTRIQ